jgi:dienelactone hydrolase
MSDNQQTPKSRSKARSFLRIVVFLSVLVIIVALVAARGPIMFIVGGGLHLPTPDGAHAVGRVSLTITDNKRDESLTEAPDDKRTLRADIYYPAIDDSSIAPGVYLEAEIAESITGLPAFATNPITPNWLPNAQPATSGGPYPVLLFSPGVDGPPTFYTTLIENLTSRGYIIVVIWHSYTFGRTIFPDGHIIESNFEANGAMWDGPDGDRDAAKQRVTRVWAADSVSTLDEIVRRNESDTLLRGLFDLEKIGVFGHSFGGQNAAAAMTLDDRFGAGLNMDGTSILSDILDNGVKAPFAFVYDTFEPPLEYLARENRTVDSWWTDWTPRNCPPAIRANSSMPYIFQIDGLAHDGFGTDLLHLRPLFGTVVTEDMVGAIEFDAMLPTITNLIDDFFDIHICGQEKKIDTTSPVLHEGIKGHPTLDGPNPPPSHSSLP